MTLKIPEIPAKADRPEFEAWMAELVALRDDPNVMKYLELRARIEESDPFALDDAQPLPWSGLQPYGLYDVFEFAHDLAGTEVSTRQLSRMSRGRFPETSSAGRGDILRFLLSRGYAEVTQRTDAGRPAVYRFPLLKEERTGGRHSGLSLPTNELSRLKGEDLDDVIDFPRRRERE